MPRWSLVLIALSILADQASKFAVLDLLAAPPHAIRVTSYFNLVLVENTGVSFGLFGDSGASRWVLVLLALAIVVALVVWMIRAQSVFVLVGLTLVVGGALSNVIDRLYHGAVIDFVDVHAAGFHWPAFNLADTLIVVGTAILLYDGLFGSPRSLK